MFKFLLTLALGFALSLSAQADGDRNREASPILPEGDNDCFYTVPSGINLTSCTLLTSPDHSQVVYFCEGLIPSDGDGIYVFCDN